MSSTRDSSSAIGSTLRATRSCAPEEIGYWNVGDKVEVKDVSGTYVRGVIKYVRHDVTVNCKNATITGKVNCTTAVEVRHISENGEEGEIIQWQDSNREPIPDLLFGKYLRKLRPSEERLSPDEKKTVQVLEHALKQMNTPTSDEQTPHRLSRIDDMLINSDNHHNILRQIDVLRRKKSCNDIVNTFAGGDKSVTTILAHFLARLATIEVASWSECDGSDISDGEQALRSLNEQIVSPVDKLKSFRSPIVSVFLGTLLSLSFSSRGAETRNQGCITTSCTDLGKRVQPVISLISMIHHSIQLRGVQVSGPGFMVTENSLDLFLDSNGGTRDATFSKLKKRHHTLDGSQVRDIVGKICGAIEQKEAREPPEDDAMVNFCVDVAENCDWDDAHAVNIASIKVGEMANTELDRLNNAFSEGIPFLKAAMAKNVRANKMDDESLQQFISLASGQHCNAMYSAFAELTLEPGKVSYVEASEDRPIPQRIKVGFQELESRGDSYAAHVIPNATTMHTSMVEDMSSKQKTKEGSNKGCGRIIGPKQAKLERRTELL